MVEQRTNSEMYIKVILKPLNKPQGASPNKGNQGTTRARGKKKYFVLGGNHDLRIGSTVTLPTEPRTESGGLFMGLKCL